MALRGVGFDYLVYRSNVRMSDRLEHMSRQRNLGQQITDLRASGKTYTEIAEELKCSKATISYWCGPGQKQKLLERNRSRMSVKRDYVYRVKQAALCADCGENYPYWQMQFDHVTGTKIANISHMLAKRDFSMQDITDEIAKCEIVCANCHANRTFTRKLESGADTLDLILFYS